MGTAPQFSAHVYFGQTAGSIKMPLGTEAGLGLSHNVLDEEPALPPKKRETAAPIFDPCPWWPNGWMDQDAVGMDVDLDTTKATEC